MDEGEIVYAPVNETAYRIRYDWLREKDIAVPYRQRPYQLMASFRP